jgi:hypothetical protein
VRGSGRCRGLEGGGRHDALSGYSVRPLTRCNAEASLSI